MKLLTSSTPIALWRDIIHDAEAACDVPLNEELESYLVFLMVRYTDKPEIIKKIVATDLLQGIHLSQNQRDLALQEVGDRCLLLSGLFPFLMQKRLVKMSYYVDLGRGAYDTISKKEDDLYQLLAKQFVQLMDVLQCVRNYSQDFPDLLPIQAFELWNETGSQRAFNLLKQYTSGIPLSDPNSKKY